MSLTFFWRCESTTFSGTDDYSAGDNTPTANGGVVLSNTQARVGTNSIYAEEFTKYFAFDLASIFDITEFAFGFSVYFESVNSGAILAQFTDASEGDNRIRVSVSGDEINVEVSKQFETAVNITTTGVNLTTGGWYGIIVRGSSTNQDIRLEVYNASDTLIEAVENTSTGSAAWPSGLVDTLHLGDEGAASPAAYLDNIFLADAYDEPIEDNFTISAYGNYVAGNAYTLTCASASFTIGGTAAGLLAGAYLAGASGSHVLTGAVAGIPRGLHLAGESDAYVLTGTDLAFSGAWRIPAESGAFGKSGTAANLAYESTVVAVSGSYLISGADLALPRGVLMDGETGAYTLTGTDTGLNTLTALIADSTAFTLEGTTNALLRGVVLSGETDLYALTGSELAFDTTVANLVAETSAFVLTGASAGVEFGGYLLAEIGVIEQGASDIAFRLGLAITMENGAFTLSGAAAALSRGVVVIGSSGQYLSNGTEAALSFSGLTDFTIHGDSDSYSVIGTDADLDRAALMAALSGTHVYTGTEVDLSQSLGFPAESGSFALNGADLDLLRSLRMSAVTEAYSLTGSIVALPYSGDVVIGRVPNIVSNTTRRSITH